MKAAHAAIEAVLKERSPLSEDAKAAVEELAAEGERQRDLLEKSRREGKLPRIHANAETGYTVTNGATGAEIGRAKDLDGARRLAAGHMRMTAAREAPAEEGADIAQAIRDHVEVLSGSIPKATGGAVGLDAETGARLGSLADIAGKNAELTARAKQRVQIAMRQAGKDMGLDEIDLARIPVLGISRNSFENGITTIHARISESGTPLTVIEETAEGIAKYLLGSPKVGGARMEEWLRDTERRTGRKILADDFAGMDEAGRVQELVEGFSYVAQANATGRIADSELPSQVKSFFRAFKEYIANALRIAADFARVRGELDPEFTHWLDVSAGITAEKRGVRAEGTAGALAGRDASFAIPPIGPGLRQIKEAPALLARRENPFEGSAAKTPKEWRAEWSAWIKENRTAWEGTGPVMLPEGPVVIGVQARDHVRQLAEGEKPGLHFEAAVRIRELLGNSALADVQEPREYEKAASEIHRRYAWMTFADGVTRNVLLTVKRWDKSKKTDTDSMYALEALEVREPGVLQVGKGSPSPESRSSISPGSGDTLARFLTGIKPEHRWSESGPGAGDIPSGKGSQDGAGDSSGIKVDLPGGTSFSLGRVEAAEIRAKIEAQTPLEVSTEGIAADMRAKEALQWAEERGVTGMVSHPEIGQIEIRKRGVKNAIGHLLNPRKAAALLKMKELIPRSTVMQFVPRGSAADSFRLAGRIRIDGTDYVARIVVDTDANGNRFYNHELSDLKELRETKDPQAPIPGVDPEGQQIGVEELEDTVMHAPADELAELRQRTGIGRQTSFSIGDGFAEEARKRELQRTRAYGEENESVWYDPDKLKQIVARAKVAGKYGILGSGDESLVLSLGDEGVMKYPEKKEGLLVLNLPGGRRRSRELSIVEDRVKVIRALDGLKTSAVLHDTGDFVLLQERGSEITEEEFVSFRLPSGHKPEFANLYQITIEGRVFHIVDLRRANFLKDSQGTIRLSDPIVGEYIEGVSPALPPGVTPIPLDQFQAERNR